eukprot:TRINITY_DN1073_c0_g1_i1.p1 TRINITY_DN1073_c0_g1~~TRINITY_DN1073_c0_g1_i1.p1  ORF type:complete len:166 (-),score=25.70 TRINITY_DN1073_c0_g1_i1:43-540(-)
MQNSILIEHGARYQICDRFWKRKLLFRWNSSTQKNQQMSNLNEPLLRRSNVDNAIVRDRNAQMNHLAKDIEDLKDTMNEIGNLIEEQGEDLNLMEDNAYTAEADVEKGVDILHTALDHQNRFRKKVCFIILVIIILLAVLSVIIYFSLPKNKTPPGPVNATELFY